MQLEMHEELRVKYRVEDMEGDLIDEAYTYFNGDLPISTIVDELSQYTGDDETFTLMGVSKRMVSGWIPLEQLNG